MAATPEGRVKDYVKAMLKEFAPDVYYHMPVQNGMGSPTLDFICCGYGQYFAIETKAPGKKPTPRQDVTIRQIRDAGGKVFVIDSPLCPDADILPAWLRSIRTTWRLQEPPA